MTETTDPKPRNTLKWCVAVISPNAETLAIRNADRFDSLAECEKACIDAAFDAHDLAFCPVKVGATFRARPVSDVRIERGAV